MHINSAEACEYMRAAFRLWVTELRPRWRGYEHYTVKEGDHLATIAARFNTTEAVLAAINHVDESTLIAGMILKIPTMYCDGMPPEEDCLLLAELDVPLIGGQADNMTNDNVHEERRPYLIHLRLLQEWLLCGRHGPTDSGDTVLSGDVIGPNNDNTVVGIQHIAVASLVPDPNQLLVHRDGQWQPTDFEGDVIGPVENNRVIKIQAVDVDAISPVPDQLLAFRSGQWRPTTLDGDVAGPAEANTVTRIQGTDVADIDPDPEQVLTFDTASRKWMPKTPAGGTVTGEFVEHPSGRPPYKIVAAGITRGDGSSRFPSYNNLKVQIVRDGLIIVTFDDYSDPPEDGSASSVYVIKAMASFIEEFEGFPNALINFGGFSGGILLYVTDRGVQVKTTFLEAMEFVIEVSEYFTGLFRETRSVARAEGSRPRIELNTASAEELRTLPRIGPELAKRIITARKKIRGGFQSLNDLLEVNGIGEDLLSVLEPFVTVTPK
jgi:competence ComEA-like helix-hairpin-helix protein